MQPKIELTGAFVVSNKGLQLKIFGKVIDTTLDGIKISGNTICLVPLAFINKRNKRY